MSEQDGHPGEFRLGLVMAAAVSAGAYSAGVLDFITEALDEYHYCLSNGTTPEGQTWDGPTHRVRVPVMAGASAGGMTAAMAAFQLYRDFEHCDGGKALRPDANRLYASWVDEIDASELLETRDLERDKDLRSALCSVVLEEIVARTIRSAPPERRVDRAWVGETDGNLRVLLTVSNLSGVPYEFRLQGANNTDAYAMMNHGDEQRFNVGRHQPDPAILFSGVHVDVDVSAQENPDNEVARGCFAAAALATGAFPIGLAARPLTLPFREYKETQKVGFERIDPKTGRIEFVQLSPKGYPDASRYNRFVAVDGGMIDNEPFELARRYLNGGRPTPNPENRYGTTTSYAVLLVDPFPNRAEWAKPKGEGDDLLLSVLMPVFGALLNQAQFKPQELSLALDPNVFSRFAILPEPEVSSAGREALPIACGALGGFSGFLHRSFRRHDYMLGRRNAQAFLRWHLYLPEDNPLFAGWLGDQRPERLAKLDAWRVRNVENWTGSVAPGDDTAAPLRKVDVRTAAADRSDQTSAETFVLPIIPLTKRLQAPISIRPEDQPRALTEKERTTLSDAIDERIEAVVEALVERSPVKEYVPFYKPGRITLKHILRKALERKARETVDATLGQIESVFNLERRPS